MTIIRIKLTANESSVGPSNCTALGWTASVLEVHMQDGCKPFVYERRYPMGEYTTARAAIKAAVKEHRIQRDTRRYEMFLRSL